MSLAPVKKYHELLHFIFGIYKLFPGVRDAKGKDPDFWRVQKEVALNQLCKIRAL